MRFRGLLLTICSAAALSVPSTAAAAWSVSNLAPLTSGTVANEPEIAVDAAGNATAVWTKFELLNNGRSSIQASSRPAGGVWSATPTALSAAIESSNEYTALTPALVVDRLGNATAIWSRCDRGTDENCIVQTARRPTGGSWSAAENLSPGGLDQPRPQLAVDGQGGVTAIWDQAASSDFVLQINARNIAGTWGTPLTISKANFDLRYPSLAVNATGSAIAIWTADKNGTPASPATGTQTQSISRVGGLWETVPHDLGAPTPNKRGPSSTAKAVVTPNGTAYATWTEASGPTPLRAAIRVPGGTWSAPTVVSGTDSIEIHSLAVDSRGKVAISWLIEAADGVSYVQRITRSPADQLAFSAPTTLGARSEYAAPEVAFGPSGALWTAFSTDEQNVATVRVAELPACSNTWGAAARVSLLGEDAQTPSLAVTAEGDPVLAWRHGFDDGSGGGGAIPQAAGVIPPGTSPADYVVCPEGVPVTPSGPAISSPAASGPTPVGAAPTPATPKITSASLAKKKFKFGGAKTGLSGAKAAPKSKNKPKVAVGGTTLNVNLSLASTLRVSITQTVPGRAQTKAGKKTCVKETKALVKAKAKACKAVVEVVKGTVAGLSAGASTLAFNGSIGPKKLKPGKYTLVLSTVADGPATSLPFTITK